jgi:hypothetical protein
MIKKRAYLVKINIVLSVFIALFFLPALQPYCIAKVVQDSEPSQLYEIPKDAFNSMEKKLEAARQVDADGVISYKKFYLTEDELNAYVQTNYGHKIAPEIKAWQIKLEGEEALILVLVNLDEFQETLHKELSPLTRRLLTGEITLKAWGYFYGQDSRGKFDIKGIRLGFIPIPVRILKQMIISKSSEEDAEVLDKGFLLPEGFHSVKVANSLIVVN